MDAWLKSAAMTLKMLNRKQWELENQLWDLEEIRGDIEDAVVMDAVLMSGMENMFMELKGKLGDHEPANPSDSES